jgi:hypothetical protein
MREPGYKVLKCPRYGFKADKNAVAVMNIEMKALFMMEGKSLATPYCPANDRCRPEQMRGTSEPPK